MRLSVQQAKEKFWSRVDKAAHDACWEWTGGKFKAGYGTMSIGNKTVSAHRFSYELHSGQPVPKGKSVLHSCDNRACVNPSHLFLGTQCDNMKDMAKKGRANKPKGSLHPRSKVTEADVTKIRASTKTIKQIADAYGISKSNAYYIKTRRSWGHVP